MSDNQKKIDAFIDYRDYVIEVDPNLYRFSVALDNDTRAYADSLAAIKEKIDAHLKSKVAAKKKKVDPVPVLAPDGSLAHFTGVHVGRGKALIKSSYKDTRFGGDLGSVYANVPWVQEALIEKKRLEGRLARISTLLNAAHISASHRYESVSADEYPVVVQQYIDKIRAAEARASDQAVVAKWEEEKQRR